MIPFSLPSSLPHDEDSIALPDILSWAGVDYDSEIVEQGLSRLLYQYQGKPRIEAFLEALMTPLQAVKKSAWDVFTLTSIDNATGVQLDTLGDVVGELRRGRLDDVYRRWIRARIRANRSSGRASDFYAILTLLYPEYASSIYDRFPGSVDLELIGAVDGEASEVNRLIQAARPAGHRVEFVYSEDVSSLTFGSTVSGGGGSLGSSVSGSGDTMGGVMS